MNSRIKWTFFAAFKMRKDCVAFIGKDKGRSWETKATCKLGNFYIEEIIWE